MEVERCFKIFHQNKNMSPERRVLKLGYSPAAPGRLAALPSTLAPGGGEPEPIHGEASSEMLKSPLPSNVPERCWGSNSDLLPKEGNLGRLSSHLCALQLTQSQLPKV